MALIRAASFSLGLLLACWAGPLRGASIPPSRIGRWDIGMTPWQMAEQLRDCAGVTIRYRSDDQDGYASAAAFSAQERLPNPQAPLIGAIYNEWKDRRFTPGDILGGLANQTDWLAPESRHLRQAVQVSLSIDPHLAVLLAEADIRLIPKRSLRGYPAGLVRLAEAYRRAGETNLLRAWGANLETFRPPPRTGDERLATLIASIPAASREQARTQLLLALLCGDADGGKCAWTTLPAGVPDRYMLGILAGQMQEGIAGCLSGEVARQTRPLLAGLAAEASGARFLPMEKRQATLSNAACLQRFAQACDQLGHADTRTVDQFLYLVEQRKDPSYLSLAGWPRPQEMIYLALRAERLYGSLRALPLYAAIQCVGLNSAATNPVIYWHDRFSAMEAASYAAFAAATKMKTLRMELPCLKAPLLDMTRYATSLAWISASKPHFPALWEHRYGSELALWRIHEIYDSLDRCEGHLWEVVRGFDTGADPRPGIIVMWARVLLRDHYLERENWRMAAVIYEQFAEGRYHYSWIPGGIAGMLNMSAKLKDASLRVRAEECARNLPAQMTANYRNRVAELMEEARKKEKR